MPIEITMPALSPTMTEGNLVKWKKKEGEKIKSGDIIAEIETDKATMELEASNTGILGKIIIQEGTEGVQVNTLIALMLKDGEDAKSLETYKPKGVQEKQNTEQTANSNLTKEDKVITETKTEVKLAEKSFASPLAKRIAESKGIDISKIEGTGPHGRVVKSDVENINQFPISNNKEAGKIISMQTQRNAEEFIVKPHTSIRKVIAKRLLESKQTVPHFYLSLDVLVSELLEVRAKINNGFEGRGIKVSVNDLIIKACALALRDFPTVNSSWSDNGMISYNNVDISVAVSTDNGLITPIVKNADIKSISTISVEMKELAKKAKENKLKPEEFQGGGFSISNLGMFGISSFSAIINPPQSCILAVGVTTKKPIYSNESKTFVPIDVVNITLSADHRVVDGALGAEFLNRIKFYLESPIMLMV